MFDLHSAQLLFVAAEKLNLQPEWLTDYGLFSIQVAGKTDYVFYATSFLNRHIHSYLARNKHVTRTILGQQGFLNIPFVLPKSLAEAQVFLDKYQVIIAKPTLGQHAQNVQLITSATELKEINLTETILEKFIVGKEYRCLVLKGEVIAVHHKQYDSPINDPEKVQRISFEKADWDDQMITTAVQVAEALHLQLSCVDFMVDELGQQFILEVNSSPGIARFHAPAEGPVVDLAGMLMEAVVQEMTYGQSD
jgi:glutathione synthase/RimK-type ligase-like ATP-grasp enzyme